MLQSSLMFSMMASAMMMLLLSVMMMTMPVLRMGTMMLMHLSLNVLLLGDYFLADLAPNLSSGMMMFSTSGLSLGESGGDLMNYCVLLLMLFRVVLCTRHIAWTLAMPLGLRFVNMVMFR